MRKIKTNKMKTKIFYLSFMVLAVTSCEKYREFDHLEVIDNSFTGSISISESAGDIDGMYNGSEDSGNYTFIWDNPTKGFVLNIDNASASGGTLQFVLEDSRGNEVLNETLTPGLSKAFSKDGKKGKWKVKIIFSDFEGNGTFDLNPIN